MKKICYLVYNEFIKSYKKISIVIITAVLLILSAVLPVITHLVSEKEGYYYDEWTENYIKEEKERIYIDDEYEHNLVIQYYDIHIEMAREQNKYSSYDFRNELIYRLYDYKSQYLFLKACLDTQDVEKIAKVYYYINYRFGTDIFYDYELIEEEAEKRPDFYIDNNNVDADFLISLEKARELYDTAESEITKIQKLIDDNDYQAYTLSKIETYKNMLYDYKQTKDMEANDPQTEKELKLTIQAGEKVLEALTYRYNNNIDYENDNWKNRALNALTNDWVYRAIYDEKLSEQEYIKTEEARWRSYDEYSNYFDRNKQEYEAMYYMAKYSLDHDIPAPEYLTQSTRSYFSYTFVYTLFIGAFLAIFAGGMISSEYSTGTIRLLMLRPVSRVKIILSKIIFLLLVMLIMLITMIFIHMVTSGILSGFGDLNYPALIYKGNGVIVEQNFMISIMPKIFICLTNTLFIASLAFFISTALKNTAIAVSLGALTYLMFIPALIIMQMGNVGAWFSKFPLLYFNMPFLYMLNEEIYYINESIVIDYNLGAIEMSIMSVILFVLAIVIFKKRDIKS